MVRVRVKVQDPWKSRLWVRVLRGKMDGRGLSQILIHADNTNNTNNNIKKSD